MRTKLIETRKKKGYTQEDMANKLNIARTTYTGYENGNFSPSLEIAIKIKEILKYKNDDIFLI
jgi:putative transcriptional regulator